MDSFLRPTYAISIGVRVEAGGIHIMYRALSPRSVVRIPWPDIFLIIFASRSERRTEIPPAAEFVL